MHERTSHARTLRGATLASGAAVVAITMSACASAPREAVDPNREYAFWPVPPGEPRIQHLRAFRSSEDVNPETGGALSRLVFGDSSESAAAIMKPYGVDMRDGKMYIADSRGDALAVLDFQKKQMRLVGVTGFNRVSNPVDVAVAEDGMIYVADNERGGVLVFDQDERFSRAIGHDNFRPVGLAVHGDRLYVCNLEGQNVEVFDRLTGESVLIIGEPGDEDGQFRVPLGIDIDDEGNVYVCDMMRARIQKFSPDGELLAAMGALGDVAGSFARPKQIAVDSEGILYVVDAAFQNVQMFNERFELLMSFGSAGEFPGAMNLPAGVTVVEDNLERFQAYAHPGFEIMRVVLVTNQFGPDKVSAYALGKRRDNWTVAELSASASERVESGAGVNPEAEQLQIPAESLDPPDGDNEM